MSVIKVLRDLDGLFNYSTDENPTSQQDYQEAVKNWVKTIVSLVDAVMWQPETEYTVGSQLLTPSLPYYVLRCTMAGTSGAAEPDYTDVALGDEITDGTVTWVVDGYLPLSGGTMTGAIVVGYNGNFLKASSDNFQYALLGGSSGEAFHGSKLILTGRNHADGGAFSLQAGNDNGTKPLIGKPDGTLTWGGKNIEQVNSSGANYIRYESGLQVCWGYTEANQTGTTVTYPVAFSNSAYRLLLQAYGYTLNTGLNNKTSTSVKITSSASSVMAGIDWLAIGFWK